MMMFAFDNGPDLVLRSGGALGADKAFERGAAEAMALSEAFPTPRDPLSYAEIYWPWPGYGDQDWGCIEPRLEEPKPEAYEIAERFHPAWYRLGRGGKALHARNCHIVLGADLDDPVDFVVCWTKGGKLKGGTAQALRIAQEYEIEIYNLALPDARERIQSFTL